MLKKIDQIIRNQIVLENNRSIINSVEVIEKIKTQPLINFYKLAPFDIVNLYNNVLVQETIAI